MIHENGTGLKRLSDTPSRRETFPTWSPDGTTVVYGAQVADGVINIYATDVATGMEHLLLADAPPSTYSVAYPTWQPLTKH